MIMMKKGIGYELNIVKDDKSQYEKKINNKSLRIYTDDRFECHKQFTIDLIE